MPIAISEVGLNPSLVVVRINGDRSWFINPGRRSGEAI
jgi:hypothetical protein